MFLNKQNFNNFLLRLSFKRNNPVLIELLGFVPGKIDLYNQALKHKSAGQAEFSNERLEFLGDAVLGLIVSTYLYRENLSISEGELSKQRSKLVNRTILNRIAKELKIDTLLHVNIGEADKPKNIYGNALEALIGAVYLDKGMKVTTEFVLNKVLKVQKRAGAILKEEIDFKSRVIEWSKSRGFQLSYETARSPGTNVLYECTLTLNNELEFKAKGESKKEAEQLASETLFKEKTINREG